MALPSRYLKSKELTATRLLLDGPMGRFYYLGERVIRQVYAGVCAKQPPHRPSDMYSTDTISGNRLHDVLHGLPIASLYPDPPPYATYDEFVRSRLMKPMTSSTLAPSGKECVIHICDQLPLSEATTPSLKHPINYPPWSVLCIQTDGSLEQEGIHRVGGDVIGLPLPCAVGDVVWHSSPCTSLGI